MKIILVDDVKGTGHKHDVKEVSDGYARNFLIPRGLARPASPSALKELEAKKTALAKEEAEIKKRFTFLAERLKDRALTFYLKTDEEGSVFGSVTKEMILTALRDNDLVTKERLQIKLDHPLKEFGTHEIEVDLKKGITTKIAVHVLPQP